MKTQVFAFILWDYMGFKHMIFFTGGSAAQSWDLLHVQYLRQKMDSRFLNFYFYYYYFLTV